MLWEGPPNAAANEVRGISAASPRPNPSSSTAPLGIMTRFTCFLPPRLLPLLPRATPRPNAGDSSSPENSPPEPFETGAEPSAGHCVPMAGGDVLGVGTATGTTARLGFELVLAVPARARPPETLVLVLLGLAVVVVVLLAVIGGLKELGEGGGCGRTRAGSTQVVKSRLSSRTCTSTR
jgi:hypothetical protein